MAIKKRVPEIRFQGFSGEWEEKKLGEMSESLQYGLNAAATTFDGYNKYLRITDIDDVTREMNVIDLTTPDVNLADSEIYSLREGDILFARTGASVGKSYRYKKTDGSVYFAGFLIRARITNEFDAEFVFQNTLTGAYGKFVRITSQRSGQPGINAQEYASFGIVHPTKDEQSKIGSFFQNLDAQITLHQRKLAKLGAVKKSMLEKMFPREGAAVPEIRFQGFKGAWERKTLGEVYTERNERGYDSLQILSVSIHTGVSNGELDSETLGKQVRRSEDKSLYKHVYAGDLILNMMRAWQGAIGVATIEGMVSPAYITAYPNDSIYPPYMDCNLRRSEIVAQMDNLSYGVTDFRKRLYWDSFIRVECHIPTVPEQQKIAAFFSNLDSLITLQQRELDKLKNIKQACLAKMFV